MNIVYFGTDTHYHLELGNGEAFVVRIQNKRDAAPDLSEGVNAGINFKDNALQVLKD